MLSAKYPIQVLARNFRTGVRCMCKKPDDSGIKDGVWSEKKGEDKTIDTIVSKKMRGEDFFDGKKTVVKPTQVGTGGLYEDHRHEQPPPIENPIHRAGRILADDVRSFKNYFPFTLLTKEKPNKTLTKHILPDFNGMVEMLGTHEPNSKIFPSHVDICIIGGGAIGSSIAYFLKERAKHGLNIAVVEKDKTVSADTRFLF